MPTRNQPVVLVVEDDETLLEVERQILEDAGYTVAAVRSAAAARRVAAFLPCDVLLTDIVLPDATGWALASELLACRRPISPVFTSGYLGSDLAAEKRLAPGEQWRLLLKPFRAATLRDTVGRALAEPLGHGDAACLRAA